MTFMKPAQKPTKPSKVEVLMGKDYKRRDDPTWIYTRPPKPIEEDAVKAPTLVSYASREDV